MLAETDPARARAVARAKLKIYLRLLQLPEQSEAVRIRGRRLRERAARIGWSTRSSAGGRRRRSRGTSRRISRPERTRSASSPSDPTVAPAPTKSCSPPCRASCDSSQSADRQSSESSPLTRSDRRKLPMAALFSPHKLGRLELSNRIVMAPMTRSRAAPGRRADRDGRRILSPARERRPHHQRRDLSELRRQGLLPNAGPRHALSRSRPGAEVTNAVHNEGGRIVAQLMHCGRVAHPDNKAARRRDGGALGDPREGRHVHRHEGHAADGGAARAHARRDPARSSRSSPARRSSRTTPASTASRPTARAATCWPSSSRPAATCARTNTGARSRTGCVSRSRLIRAMAAVDGGARVGFRICPGNPFNDLSDANPEETFRRFLGGLRDLGLAYCHVIRLHNTPLDNLELARTAFGGPLIVNDSYKRDEAIEVVESGRAAAVSFARSYIGNPDLVHRLEAKRPARPIRPERALHARAEGLRRLSGAGMLSPQREKSPRVAARRPRPFAQSVGRRLSACAARRGFRSGEPLPCSAPAAQPLPSSSSRTSRRSSP